MKESLSKNNFEDNFFCYLTFHLALTKLISDPDYEYAFRISYRKILLVRKSREEK